MTQHTIRISLWVLVLFVCLVTGCGDGTGGQTDPASSAEHVDSRDEHDEHDDTEAEGAHEEPGGHEDTDEHREGLVELSPEKLAAIEISVVGVARRRLSPQLETTGEVGFETDRLAHVSPRIPGRVESVSASLGDEVKRGQVLARIDSVELGQAKAAFLSARAHEDVANETYRREQRLFADRISSEKEMLEAKADYLQAQAVREGAEETLRLYGLGAEDIEGLRAGQEGASALSIVAPISGRVVEKHVTLGELVSPSESLFTIADLGHVWIWIDVFERDLSSVHEDDQVEVRVDSFPERVFYGEVTYLSSEVAPETRTVRARIDVENADRLLRPGMFATVRVTDPHATGGRDSLVVPEASVVRSGDSALVFRPLGDGRFQAQPIESGRHEGGFVEVISGLAEGDSVVALGSFFLKSELARSELGGGHSH